MATRRATIETTLAALATMSPAQLREAWVSTTDKPVPRLSSAMLRLALGYELQCKALGGLSRPTRQRLDQLAAAKTQTRCTVPGMRLVREHNGTAHVVTIGDDGGIEWNGRTWRSLSEVARTITGTQWSGPAFFGLKQTKVKAA